jgi:3-hydroxyacyl-[acyl-carrier-protein] dehydratase
MASLAPSVSPVLPVPTPTASPVQPLADSPTWWLDPAWPVFAGHFPGAPVLPGAALLDWAMQAQGEREPGVAWQCAWAKFPRAAVPGDRLRLTLNTTPRGRAFTIECVAHDGDAQPGADLGQPHIVASGLLVPGHA